MELFACLEKAISSEDTQTREVVHEIEVEQTRKFAIAQEVDQTREFAIGDKVIIKNPNLFQADRGAITKIGNKRITVTSQSGSKILGASKDLVLKA
jgi:hypothetical protein